MGDSWCNIHPCTVQYCKNIDVLFIVIGPNSRTITSSIPDERRRNLNVQLLRRFLFLLLKNLIKASFHVFFVNGTIYMTRISIFVADKPWERTLYVLKRCDSHMDGMLCTLQSGLRNMENPQISLMSSSSDYDGEPRKRRPKSVRKTTAQSFRSRHKPHELSVTLPDHFVSSCMTVYLQAAIHFHPSHLTLRSWVSICTVMFSRPWVPSVQFLMNHFIRQIGRDWHRHHAKALWFDQHCSTEQVMSVSFPSNIYVQWSLFLPSSVLSLICRPSISSQSTVHPWLIFY